MFTIPYRCPTSTRDRLARSKETNRAFNDRNWRSPSTWYQPCKIDTTETTVAEDTIRSAPFYSNQQTKVDPGKMVPGLILYLPPKNKILGSKISMDGEAWHGVDGHPILVRKVGHVGQSLLVEFHPLVSFSSRTINEVYPEDNASCRGDRRRAMLIEHSRNQKPGTKGAWDNSDCPEKLHFEKQYGETVCPSYVRIDKTIWLEAEHFWWPTSCTSGCRVDMESLGRLLTKRPSPSNSPLYSSATQRKISCDRVCAKDLQKLREMGGKHRSASLVGPSPVYGPKTWVRNTQSDSALLRSSNKTYGSWRQ